MKHKNAALTFLLCVIIILGACTPKDDSQVKLSAKLSELSGTVDIKNPGTDTFESANTETTLKVNGQVQTGDDGRVRLDLSSGTIIRVGPSSLFTLISNEEVEGGLATKIKLQLGKIFIILNGGRADVETPSGVASVRGSYIKVEVDPDTLDIYITCLEGDCSASNPAGAVNFTNGQKTILFHRNPTTGNWTIPNVEDMTPEEFQEWLDNNPEARELFNQASATMTAMAPSPTPTEPPTEAPTEPPAVQPVLPQGNASNKCLNIIEPVEGSSLPFKGKVKFQWDARPDAKFYRVTFYNEKGDLVSFDTTETSIEKYIEIFAKGGNYGWNVTAFGENDAPLCKTENVSFSKPESNYVPDKPKEEENACNPCDEEAPCYDPYNSTCYQE